MFGWFKKNKIPTVLKKVSIARTFKLTEEEYRKVPVITGFHRYRFLTNEDKVIEFTKPFKTTFILDRSLVDENLGKIDFVQSENCELKRCFDFFRVENEFYEWEFGNQTEHNHIPNQYRLELNGVLYLVKAWISCEFVEENRHIEEVYLRTIKQQLEIRTN